jgi:hypothetical protein
MREINIMNLKIKEIRFNELPTKIKLGNREYYLSADKNMLYILDERK